VLAVRDWISPDEIALRIPILHIVFLPPDDFRPQGVAVFCGYLLKHHSFSGK